jgi:hypothetical protein
MPKGSDKTDLLVRRLAPLLLIPVLSTFLEGAAVGSV